MRTTMNLSDALFQSVKRRAEEEGRTVTSLIEEALRDLLAKSKSSAQVDPLPTYGRVGSRMLIDIEDRDALFEALDADGPR